MPSLHSFNTCWGNRRYFHDVYCEQSPYDWFHSHEQESSDSSTSRGFISSNGYYGYQPIPRVPSPCEAVYSMEVEVSEPPKEISGSVSRKRPSSQPSSETDLKRFKAGTADG